MPADAPTSPHPTVLLTALRSIGARVITSAPRLAYWLPQELHRYCCPNGHVFTPRGDPWRGAIHWNCEWSEGRGSDRTVCRTELLVVVILRRRIKFVAEISPADRAFIRSEGYDAVDELVYLQTEPLRREPVLRGARV